MRIGRFIALALFVFPGLAWLESLQCAEPLRLDVVQRGAVGDGSTLNTVAIQKVIDQCAQTGGTVVVPRGVFLSGALFLKPGVSLELQEGAVLKGSANIQDYPKLNTRIEGHFEPWRAALINADGTDGLSIAGPGTLDGNGAPYWAEFWRQRRLNPKVTNLAVERPRLVLIQNTADVQIKGVTFKDSGFWNLHLYRSHRVTVEGCRFQAPNDPPPNHAASSDGIDVDSCQDVTIKGCFFAVGDDCIALKGSKGPFATRDESSPPVERIRVEDCTFETGGAVVTFGSEATTVRGVEVVRCRIVGPVPILRLKLRPDTGQRYENVVCRDITGENAGAFFDVAPWKQFFDLKGQPPPKRAVRNILIEDVKGSFDSFGKIVGNPGDEIAEVILKNVDVKLRREKMEMSNVDGLKFESVVANDQPVTAPLVRTEPVTASPEAWNTF